MKKLLLFILLLFIIPVYAQELNEQQLDSLYERFLRMKEVSATEYPDHPEVHYENEKCGFGIVNQVKLNLERYSPEKQQVLKSLFNRPVTQTSITSPAGFFRIHYNATGTEVPRFNLLQTTEQNVEQVGIALDSSFNFEINFLGYLAPPSDTAGGDNKYDVYIVNLGSSLYGYTEFEDFLGNGKYNSFIVIDNDYSGFYSAGFDGMRVTVAHEFHHSIQVGKYTAERINNDTYFYELTSTSMEEFVYDDINDYYAYMPDYFNNTERSFSQNNGYNLAIWNIFLKDKFDIHIIKKQWELLRDFSEMRALNAINASIIEYNSNFRDIFHEFGVWTFFTNRRAKQGEYFEEAANYPLAQTIIPAISFQPPDEKVTVNSKPAANSFVSFINANTTPDDTLTLLLTNADYNTGVSSPSSDFSAEYTLFDFSAPGSRRLNENYIYYALLNVDQPSFWSNSEFLNSDLISTYKFTAEYDYAFPSPFIYGKNTFIFIPVSSPESDEADLNIYTTSMDLVYSVNQTLVRHDNQPGIRWDVLNNDKQRLASGVYIYAIKSGDKTSVGKLVIFNE